MALFSATYDDTVMNFAKQIIRKPLILRLKREEESLDNIKQFYIKCNTNEDKYMSLANIYGTITVGQAMIFCQVSLQHTMYIRIYAVCCCKSIAILL